MNKRDLIKLIALLVTLLGLEVANSSTVQACSTAVVNSAKNIERTPFRQKYWDLAVSAKAPEGSAEREIFVDYMHAHLKKFDDRFKEKAQGGTPSKSGQSNQLSSIYDKLNSISTTAMQSKDMGVMAFNRLTLLHSQLMDFYFDKAILDKQNLNGYFGGYKGIEPAFVSLVFSDKDQLVNWVLHQKGHLVPTTRFDFEPPKGAEKVWTFLPTFANLGFESILWAISRRIFFVGQSSIDKLVDREPMPPSQFQEHDYGHSRFLTNPTMANFPSLEVSMRFWDQLEARVMANTLEGDQRKLVYLVFFQLMHERTALQMTCPDRDPFANWISSDLHVRIQDESDFASAFSKPPTLNDVNWASSLASRILVEICGLF